MHNNTLRLSVYGVIFLAMMAVVPFFVGAQERSDTNTTTVGSESEVEAEASYNNTRSNRSVISGPGETNVCDGVTCSDGSCAATPAECGIEADVAPAADSVCNGYLCDSGECASSEAMCGLDVEELAPVADSVCSDYLCDNGQCVTDELWCDTDFDFEVSAGVAADSVCNGYLCSDGTCASSETMCGLDFEELSTRMDKCPADSPIRCGDGSCSSEVSRCLAIEKDTNRPSPATDRTQNITGDQLDEMDEEFRARGDSDGDGLDDGSERANYNNSRSNKSTVRDSDNDSDGDGLDDGSERAQDYNSTRSNKPTRSVFSDTDADGRPEVTLRGGAFVETDADTGEETESSTEAGDVKCWGRAEDEDGRVYAWGQGICVALQATEEASDTARERLAAIQVRGDAVRGWNEEQRASWREYRESRATTSPEETVAERMVEETQNDERIQEMQADDNGVEVQYRAQMRLFGLIPLEREVTAVSTSEGEAEIDYPWYSFLATKPDTQVLRDLVNAISTIDVGGGSGKVSI